MTKTFNLTDKELRASMAFVKSCLHGMGGDRPSDLDNDPYTWINLTDLTKAGFSRHEAAGLMGSLEAKGVIYEYDKNEWVLADDGFRFLDTLWDTYTKTEA